MLKILIWWKPMWTSSRSAPETCKISPCCGGPEDPNGLWHRTNDGPAQLYRRGNGYLCDAAQRATRLPPGHPEAFIEAFANIYANATDAIRAKILGQEPDELILDFPTVIDGARGLAFIESAVESSQSDQKWYPMKAFK